MIGLKYKLTCNTNERNALQFPDVAKRGLTCGVLPKTTGISYMREGSGSRDRRRVTQEVMRVVVAGGYIVPGWYLRRNFFLDAQI